jgi:hypothetical protein
MESITGKMVRGKTLYSSTAFFTIRTFNFNLVSNELYFGGSHNDNSIKGAYTNRYFGFILKTDINLKFQWFTQICSNYATTTFAFVAIATDKVLN